MYYCSQCNEFVLNYDVAEDVYQISSCEMKEDGFEEVGEVQEITESQVSSRFCRKCDNTLTWGVLDWVKTNGETVHSLYTEEQLTKIRKIMFSKGLSRLENSEVLICKILI